MGKMNVSPTKSVLLKIKGQLNFAVEGHALLDQKREVLVMEIMRLLATAELKRKATEEELLKAYAACKKAYIFSGPTTIMRAALATRDTLELDFSPHTIMGVSLLKVKTSRKPLRPQYGPGGTTASLDEAVVMLQHALEKLADLAEVEVSIFRLAAELKKTQQRVNALENIFIPQYRETVKYLQDTLEEKDREGIFVMKRIKSRLKGEEAEAG